MIVLKQIEYIAINVLIWLIGWMIFLLTKIRSLTDRLMDDYERRAIGDVKRT